MTVIEEIRGMVERGSQSAGTRGFPTANIRADLPVGFYVGMTQYGPAFVVSDQFHKGMIEVHIFDFEQDIYGQELVVKKVTQFPTDLLCLILQRILRAEGKDVFFIPKNQPV